METPDEDWICPIDGVTLNSDGTCPCCLTSIAEETSDNDLDFFRTNPTSHPNYEPESEDE